MLSRPLRSQRAGVGAEVLAKEAGLDLGPWGPALGIAHRFPFDGSRECAEKCKLDQ